VPAIRRSAPLLTLAAGTLAAGALAAGCASRSPAGEPPAAAKAPVLRREPSDNSWGYTIADAATPQATAELGRLDDAVHRYAKDRAGRLPTTLSALSTERSLDGDLYLARVPTDPWGRPYVYAVLNPRIGLYDLRSYGPDTMPGTPDDVAAKSTPVSTH
jgi:hypothetical protein